MNHKTSQNGFSLLELLVVVLIIAIIAAIAIPSLLASRRAANETTTAANLRTIHTGQFTYRANGSTIFTNLAGLNTAGILDDSWAVGSVVKNTYTYSLTRNASNLNYCVLALSAETGSRDLGVGTDGVIYEAAHGTMTCTDGSLGGALTVYGSN